MAFDAYGSTDLPAVGLIAAGFVLRVLGGGYGADDGIFRYKRSFAPHGLVPFFVGRRARVQVRGGVVVESVAASASTGTANWSPPRSGLTVAAADATSSSPIRTA